MLLLWTNVRAKCSKAKKTNNRLFKQTDTARQGAHTEGESAVQLTSSLR
jgi:hypothetical protein